MTDRAAGDCTAEPQTAGHPDEPGLLVVLSQPQGGGTAAFHQWYDEEHLPARINVPGITTAARYERTDGQSPRWLALYDLTSLSVLDRPDYRLLRSERSKRERRIMAELNVLDRRTYRMVDNTHPAESPVAPYVVANWMTPTDAGRYELHRWYKTEHIPMLLKVPGWLRIRRFELVDGNGPPLLTLHDIEDLAVADTPEYQRAITTPWRRNVLGSLRHRERAVFRLYQRGDRSQPTIDPPPCRR